MSMIDAIIKKLFFWSGSIVLVVITGALFNTWVEEIVTAMACGVVYGLVWGIVEALLVLNEHD